MPDSLLEPMKWLQSHEDCDALISNGHFVKEDGALAEHIRIADHTRLGSPALSLLDDSWLQPGAFIFRTSSIAPSMLDSGWSHMEWTRLAFELCAERKRLHFMDVGTVHYHDTPGSASKQILHQDAALNLPRQVRQDIRLDPEVRRKAWQKYLRILHNLAMVYRNLGQYGRAWHYHFRSLRPPQTIKYMLYSRKLL